MQREYLSRFNETTFQLIESLEKILGRGGFYVTNGASLYYRLAKISINRVPTDLDIVTPNSDLLELQKALSTLGVKSEYDPSTVTKWGLKYCEPQLRGVINDIPFDLVSKSTIVKPNGERLIQHQELSSPDWVVYENMRIPVARLETVKQAKEFQLRAAPKQDISDLEHIELLIAMELLK